MNKLLEIKHVHHILDLLLYKKDSIENVTNLKSFVKFYCEPKTDLKCMEICLNLLQYSMEIGAKKIYFLKGNGEYSLKNNNIKTAISELENDWPYLQSVRKIDGKEWLIEYWLECTDEFREELKRIDILKK